MVAAAMVASIALVMPFAVTVVATAPALVVTTPVSAGILAAGTAPEVRSEALPDVAMAASPPPLETPVMRPSASTTRVAVAKVPGVRLVLTQPRRSTAA